MTTWPGARRSRRALVIGMLAVGAMAVAACSSSGAGSAGGGSSSSAANSPTSSGTGAASSAASSAGGSTSSGTSSGASSSAAPAGNTASSAGGGSATGSSASAPAKAATGSPLTVGELFPFTGSKSVLSTWGIHGVAAGIYEINHHGGVLGHPLKSSSADDAADAVDALPALRKLFLDHPSFVVGPFSPTIEAVIKEFAPNNIPDFMIGGTTQLNDMSNPWVFRTTASDSTEAVAMAYYAIKKGYKKAALIFDNSANSQGYVAPLTAAYQKLGGTVTAVQEIVPGQSSYRSGLIKAFAGQPQVVFSGTDTQTASTMWSDAAQLGYLSAHWVGVDTFAASVFAKAFGPTASTNLVSAVPAAPSGQAYNHFLKDYEAVYKTSSPLPTTYNEYDSIVIAALAMTEAKSTDPTVWVKHVQDVATPPGTKCYDYAACVSLLGQGKQIDFEGAGGNDDFNSHHNVFSGFEIQGFTSSDAPRQAGFVTAQEIRANASSKAYAGH